MTLVFDFSWIYSGFAIFVAKNSCQAPSFHQAAPITPWISINSMI